MQFLMGLDDVYLPIRRNILTRDPFPSVKSAFAIISGEESHRGVVSNGTPSKPLATAFVSKGFDNKKICPDDDDGRVSSNDDGTKSLTSQEEDGDYGATATNENTPPKGITETFLGSIVEYSDQRAKTVAPKKVFWTL
nr:hypothetical protein [Tanacetum cinerariifolium]